MADVASKQQTTAMFLSTIITRKRKQTELTKKITDKPDGKPVLCQRIFSSVFRAVFYTVKLHSLIRNYSQRDVNFFEFNYFYRRSTCFRQFLRPSSGVNNCTYSFRYCQTMLLLALTMEGMEPKFHFLHGSS
jgi:hypothetical protein